MDPTNQPGSLNLHNTPDTRPRPREPSSVTCAICVLTKRVGVTDIVREVVMRAFDNEDFRRENYLHLIPPPFPEYVWKAAMARNNKQRLLSMYARDPVKPEASWILLVIRGRCFESLEFIDGVFMPSLEKRKKWGLIDYAFETNDEQAIPMAEVLRNMGFSGTLNAYKNAMKTKNLPGIEWIYNNRIVEIPQSITREFVNKAVRGGDVAIARWFYLHFNGEIYCSTVAEVMQARNFPMLEWFKVATPNIFTARVFEDAVRLDNLDIIDFILSRIRIEGDNAPNPPNNDTNPPDNDASPSDDYLLITLDEAYMCTLVAANAGLFEMFKFLHQKFKHILTGDYCDFYAEVNRNCPDTYNFYEYIRDHVKQPVRYTTIFDLFKQSKQITSHNQADNGHRNPENFKLTVEIVEWFLHNCSTDAQDPDTIRDFFWLKTNMGLNKRYLTEPLILELIEEHEPKPEPLANFS